MKFLIIILVLSLTPAWSSECWNFSFKKAGFTACTAKLPEDDIRLFLNDKNGKHFGQFQKLEMFLKKQGLNIIFATNAGMVHSDRSPIDMYIENFKKISPLIIRDGLKAIFLISNEAVNFHQFASAFSDYFEIDHALH